MKKIFSIALLLLSGYGAFGQWSFQNSDFATAIDSAYYKVCDTTGITPGGSGASTTWNFASWTPSGTTVTVRYKAPNQVAGVPAPPGSATLAYNPSNSDYYFYNVAVDSLYIVGEKSDANTFMDYTSSTFTGSDPVTALAFPFDFNDIIIDSMGAKYPDGFFSQIERRGQVTTEYDAWGDVTTPAGSFGNVLRIHRTWVAVDSSITGLATGFTTAHEYLWYEQGTKTFICRLWDQITVLNGSPQKIKEVWFSDVFPTAIDPAVNNDRLSVTTYPNPATEVVNVKYLVGKTAPVTVEIFSADGRLVQTIAEGVKTTGVYELAVDVKNYAAGSYLVKLTSGENKITRHIVVE